MYFLGKKLSSVTNAITTGRNRVDTANRRLLHHGYAELILFSPGRLLGRLFMVLFLSVFMALFNKSSVSLSPFHTPTVPMAVGRA